MFCGLVPRRSSVAFGMGPEGGVMEWPYLCSALASNCPRVGSMRAHSNEKR